MPYPKAIDTEKPTVFVGGIPKTADTSKKFPSKIYQRFLENTFVQ